MMTFIDTEQQGNIDSSRLETSFSNVFEVFSAPGEIVLAFGALKPAGVGRNCVVSASIANRIILSPHLAKRFSILLAGKVLEYESVFGPLTGEAEKEKNSPGSDMPQYASERNAEKAAALIKLIETLDVDFCLERSFKISDRLLLTGRFIAGFNKLALHGNQNETACSAFIQMGMPERFMDECRKLLSATEFIHFGFEEQPDGCLYKVYLEFRIQNRSSPHAGRGTREPYLLFLGFKWDPLDTHRSAMSRYTCFPLLSPDDIMEKLCSLFEGNPDCKLFETVHAVLNKTAGRLSGSEIIYQEVSEENNPRKSFDINLYDANLCIRDISPLLMDVGRHYNLPVGQFMHVCDSISGKRFGHLSGGVDREGKDFLTVYYGVEDFEKNRLPHSGTSASLCCAPKNIPELTT